MSSLRTQIIIGLIAFMLASGGFVGLRWHYINVGKEAQKVEQQKAQKKHEKKVKATYADIDKNTPFNAERNAQLEWLQRSAVRQ